MKKILIPIFMLILMASVSKDRNSQGIIREMDFADSD